MDELDVPEELRDELRAAWHRYLDLVTPLRPALHRYCLRLTRDVWDAEDLVADTLLRGFGTLGKLHQQVRSQRSYLLRSATNLWIDALRRRETAAAAPADPEPRSGPDGTRPLELREAGAMLMQRLAPRERAAVVLKDVFDLSLEQTADVLETSVGAVKAALHRGRDRLRDDEPMASSPRTPPSVELVDRFVAAFNAGDVTRVAGLLLETATQEHVGTTFQFGIDALAGKQGWLRGALVGHPEWPAIFQYEAQHVERRIYLDEPVVLLFRSRSGFEMCEQVIRIEERDGRICRIRDYGFCPETVAIVAEALGVEWRGGLYRYPTPAPGRSWADP